MCFKLFGTRINIEFGFILIISFAIIFGNSSVLYVLLFSSLHELGHLVSLCLMGGKAERLNISFYGIGLLHKSTLSFFKEIIFLLSGIIVNLIFVLFNIHRDINLSLMIINLIPIYPLDGGRVFKLVLNNLFSFNISDRIYRVISVLFILLVIFYCLYSKNISLIIISGYLIGYSISNSVE